MQTPHNKDNDEEIVIVPVPSLIAVLANAEDTKGTDLTQQEVLEIRDNCACIAMPKSIIATLEEKRGYPDINPEFAWEQWLDYKASL